MEQIVLDQELNESINLINWAFNQTSQKILVEKNQVIKEVDVWLGVRIKN